MSAKCAKLALVFLLLAGVAFVSNVLSPFTPTPNADLAGRILFSLFILLFILGTLPLQWIMVRPEARLVRLSGAFSGIEHSGRSLIVFICSLLC